MTEFWKKNIDFIIKKIVVFSMLNWQFSSTQKYPTSLYNKASLELSVEISSQSDNWSLS